MTHLLHRNLRTPPEIAISGDGIRMSLANGKTVIDAAGGAAVACIGHGNARVAARIGEQARRFAYAHTLFFSNEPAEELAECLVGHQPGGLTHAFFTSSGSEATEAALKLARQYFVEVGKPERTRFIARQQGYHGNTLGALSASGHRSRRSIYDPILMSNFSFVSPCFPYHYMNEGETEEAYVARLAAELDNEFKRLGPENVAAFVAEPIVGATSGCVAAVPGYFVAVKEVCDRYGALLILDEIMCGMGRSGSQHVWMQEEVVPDLQVVAKGLGGGYVSIGAMLVGRRVSEALVKGSGSFAHGHTYQAHPVACAGALEVQRIIAEESLIERVHDMAPTLEGALTERFGEHRNVGQIRGRGYFQGIEFVRDRAEREAFDPSIRFSERLKAAALDLGLAIYPNGGTIDGVKGDHVIIAPPFNATPEEIELIADLLKDALDRAVETIL